MKEYAHRYDVLYSKSELSSDEIFESGDYELVPVYIDTYAGAKNVADTIKIYVPDVKRIQIDYAIYSYDEDGVELIDSTVINEVILKDGDWIEE